MEPPPERSPPLEPARSNTPDLARTTRSLGSDRSTSSAVADEVHHLYLLQSSSTVAVQSFFTNVWSYVGRLISLGQWFGTLMLFVVANFALPLICGCQLVFLDLVFARQGVGSLAFHFVWAVAFFEACLLVHLMRYRAQMYAVGNGGLQWIVYSWLISAKSCVLYFKVLPQLSSAGASDELLGSATTEWLFDARGIVTILWLTPVFYAVLTFRTLRELFQTDKTRRVEAGGRHRYRRDKEEHTNLDVVLLSDMVWHVVIDMIDIFYMMFMANPYDEEDSIVDTAILQKHPETVRRVKALVGAFIFLGLFFHQQSFPSIGFTGASSWPAPPPPRRSSSKRKTQANIKSQQPPQLPQQLEYRVDVIKARKRSAIVSLLMVDLPFFIIRTYMYILAMNSQAPAATTTTPGPLVRNTLFYSVASPLADWLGRPQLDKWWVKNIICMLLQAMQLRFVQQAELERSQTLRWWDVRRSVSAAAMHGARRRRWEQDRNLQRKWQELDRSKMEAALEDTGYFPDSPEQGGRGHGSGFEQPSVVVTEPQDTGSSSPGSPVPSPALLRRRSRLHRSCLSCRRQWHCCCACCRNCSFGIAAHMMMGAVLGWLIAKVDFNQAVTDLMLGLGRS